MKTMMKAAAVIAALVMAFSLTGCAFEDENEDQTEFILEDLFDIVEDFNGHGITLYLVHNDAMPEDGIARIPDEVVYIRDKAFQNCTNLKEVIIPANVTSIGDDAFDGCTALKTVTFAGDSKLKAIGSWCFDTSPELKTIVIPDGVRSIGEYAFGTIHSSYATELDNATLPRSVEWIGVPAFLHTKEIIYKGTQSDWRKIEKGGSFYDLLVGADVIRCTDGDITE